MKRSLAVAALATVATTSVFAQSNITIYGRLNESVERQKTGSESIWAVQNSSSRIGFKGTEDLGGGLKAFFLIEHGFSPDTGAANAVFWGRESNVGLEGSFGKVRLGNMGPTAAYFGTADYVSMHNHDTGTSADAFYLYPGDARNMIAYSSPNVAGFSGEVQYGLKETTAANTKNTFVLRGDYDQGPLHLGAVYLSGAAENGTHTGSAKEFGLRGLYEMGAFTFGGYFVNDKITDPATNLEAKRDAYRLSAMYAMGASEFHANIGWAGKWKVGGATVADSNATQYTLAYNYNLSKRTKVYAFYTAVNNKANAIYNVPDTMPGADFSSFAVGIRHNF